MILYWSKSMNVLFVKAYLKLLQQLFPQHNQWVSPTGAEIRKPFSELTYISTVKSFFVHPNVNVETGVQRAFVSTYPLVHKAAGDWNCGTGNEFWVHRWSKMYWNPQDQKNGLSHSPLDSEVQGALVQSRFQDVTEMDAPSSFFFRLKKKHEQSKAFRS